MNDPSPNITVREVIARFLADQERRHAGKLIADATLTHFHHRLGLFAERYGDRPALTIRANDITTWILGHPGWKSDHTRHDAARCVMACFKWAYEEELLDRNPIRKLKQCWGVLRPREAIKPEEYHALMAAAKRCDGRTRHARPSRGPFRAALWFLWHTGCRTCEMREARWEEVDWAARLLKTTRHKTARATGAVRLIPLTPRVLRLLRWVHRARRPGPQDRIFLNGRGRPWDKLTFGKLFRQFARMAGVRKEVSPYSLRHGFTVRGLENGVGERQLADVLGHTTTRYVAWYGQSTRNKGEYLCDVAAQVDGRKPRRDGKGGPA